MKGKFSRKAIFIISLAIILLISGYRFMSRDYKQAVQPNDKQINNKADADVQNLIAEVETLIIHIAFCYWCNPIFVFEHNLSFGNKERKA